MPINVLVVDDSSFFQQRLRETLDQHAGLNVIGVAANGAEAVEKTLQLRPDVITMDYEMPVMDGITAVRQIMAKRPTPILMFSSLTYQGARITLDALEAGAVDFLSKDFSEIASDSKTLSNKLYERLVAISHADSGERSRTAVASSKGSIGASRARGLRAVAAPGTATNLKGKVKLVLLGASTGGPVALNEVLRQLPANFPLPIVLVQHMPENFTRAFAERLNSLSKLRVREARDGDSLRPGTALLAPGGKQLMIDRRGVVRILPGDSRVNYRPSLDITFGSAANWCAEGVLAVIMTGMGSDGCEGARLLKQRGGHVWSQDEASCVIYGMPMAVARAGLSDRILGLNDIGRAIAEEF